MKHKITQEEYDRVTREAQAASELLTEERFEFLRDYLKGAALSIESSILNNTVRDVTEEVTITESIKRHFFSPKSVQIDELAGQYKFISQLLSDLENLANLKKDLDAQLEAKRVVVE